MLSIFIILFVGVIPSLTFGKMVIKKGDSIPRITSHEFVQLKIGILEYMYKCPTGTSVVEFHLRSDSNPTIEDPFYFTIFTIYRSQYRGHLFIVSYNNDYIEIIWKMNFNDLLTPSLAFVICNVNDLKTIADGVKKGGSIIRDPVRQIVVYEMDQCVMNSRNAVVSPLPLYSFTCIMRFRAELLLEKIECETIHGHGSSNINVNGQALFSMETTNGICNNTIQQISITVIHNAPLDTFKCKIRQKLIGNGAGITSSDVNSCTGTPITNSIIFTTVSAAEIFLDNTLIQKTVFVKTGETFTTIYYCNSRDYYLTIYEKNVEDDTTVLVKRIYYWEKKQKKCGDKFIIYVHDRIFKVKYIKRINIIDSGIIYGICGNTSTLARLEEEEDSADSITPYNTYEVSSPNCEIREKNAICEMRVNDKFGYKGSLYCTICNGFVVMEQQMYVHGSITVRRFTVQNIYTAYGMGNTSYINCTYSYELYGVYNSYNISFFYPRIY